MNKIAKFVYAVKRKIIDFAILTSIKDEDIQEEGEALWKKAAIQISKEEQEESHEPTSPLKRSARGKI